MFKLIEQCSLEVDETIIERFILRFGETTGELRSPLKKFDKILTDRGFCYTINLQNHDILFTDQISSDFDSYNRSIKEGVFYRFVTRVDVNLNETDTWTLANGYQTSKKFVKLC